MTGSLEFPKVDGDVLYAASVNNFEYAKALAINSAKNKWQMVVDNGQLGSLSNLEAVYDTGSVLYIANTSAANSVDVKGSASGNTVGVFRQWNRNVGSIIFTQNYDTHDIGSDYQSLSGTDLWRVSGGLLAGTYPDFEAAVGSLTSKWGNYKMGTTYHIKSTENFIFFDTNEIEDLGNRDLFISKYYAYQGQPGFPTDSEFEIQYRSGTSSVVLFSGTTSQNSYDLRFNFNNGSYVRRFVSGGELGSMDITSVGNTGFIRFYSIGSSAAAAANPSDMTQNFYGIGFVGSKIHEDIGSNLNISYSSDDGGTWTSGVFNYMNEVDPTSWGKNCTVKVQLGSGVTSGGKYINNGHLATGSVMAFTNFTSLQAGSNREPAAMRYCFNDLSEQYG